MARLKFGQKKYYKINSLRVINFGSDNGNYVSLDAISSTRATFDRFYRLSAMTENSSKLNKPLNGAQPMKKNSSRKKQKNQTTPYQAEIESRIGETAKFIADGLGSLEMKNAISRKYSVTSRTAEKYIKDAYARMAEYTRPDYKTLLQMALEHRRQLLMDARQPRITYTVKNGSGGDVYIEKTEPASLMAQLAILKDISRLVGIYEPTPIQENNGDTFTVLIKGKCEHCNSDDGDVIHSSTNPKYEPGDNVGSALRGK